MKFLEAFSHGFPATSYLYKYPYISSFLPRIYLHSTDRTMQEEEQHKVFPNHHKYSKYPTIAYPFQSWFYDVPERFFSKRSLNSNKVTPSFILWACNKQASIFIHTVYLH